MTTAMTLVALPAVTSVLVLARARHATLSSLVAILGALATLVVAGLAVGRATPGPEGSPFADGRATGWGLSFGGIDLALGVSLSVTSAFLVLVVSLVVAAVQGYSAWYLAHDDRRGVFHATIALFAAAMILVVLSADLVLTIVDWEVMGWCSYLLIGHWSRRSRPRRAAHTAFIVTRVADIGLLLGVAILVAGAGSTARSAVIEHWVSDGADATLRSSASSASPRSCPSTTGCSTRWRARPRHRPSSTPRRWSPPARWCSPSCCRCSSSPTPPAPSSGCPSP